MYTNSKLLGKKLNNQFIYAIAQFILGLILLGIIPLYGIASIIGPTFSICWLVFWIIGIVNAVSINKLTKDSSVLLVFSIITLLFVHLIFVIVEQNKYKHSVIHNPDLNSQEDHLKNAFNKGIISSKEYEEKRKLQNQSKPSNTKSDKKT